MINGTGHDHTLDWWTLGILVYEMVVGIPPFYNQNKHKMYYLIENGPIRWPTVEKHGFEITPEAQDIIEKLLTKDKGRRLGKVGDMREVLAHPWFSDLDITKLINKELQSPYVPVIKTQDDTSNFDEKFSQLEIAESIIDPQKVQLI